MLHWLTDNFWWKLSSLLLAAGIYLFYTGETEVATSVPALLEFRNLPADLEVTSEFNDRLFLKLKGPAAKLTTSQLVQTAVTLDLASVVKPGEQTFTLNQSNVSLPSGVRLLQVVPAQVRVSFETRVSREIPVEVTFTGPPPEGYRIASQSVNPPRVRVTGPKSRIDRITAAKTDAIDLDNQFGEAEFRPALYLDEPQARVEGAASVTVQVRLERVSPAPPIGEKK